VGEWWGKRVGKTGDIFGGVGGLDGGHGGMRGGSKEER